MAKRTLAQSADKQQMVQRLQKIQPNSQRLWGKMTASEMICHLSDSFRVAMGEKTTGPLKEKLLPLPMPLPILKWLALDCPLHWPKGVKTRAEIDPQRAGTKPGDFPADMRELRRLLERFTQKPRDFEWQAHPIFGLMRDEEWQRWGYLHMDHHLRQFGV